MSDPHSGWRSRHYLPHYDGEFVLQHVVFRLADSLPRTIAEDARALSAPLRMEATAAALDAGNGARLLADPRAGTIVQDALKHFEGVRYGLEAWCVMPTHVHVLAERREGWPLASVVHSWKSFTANAINHATGRSGAVWSREYYDRFMREAEQGEATIAYIENNPVSAGLCATPEDWPWSSAKRRHRDRS